MPFNDRQRKERETVRRTKRERDRQTDRQTEKEHTGSKTSDLK